MTSLVGLYIHIPFCNKICPFCDFTKVKTNKNLFQSYFDSLVKEINHYSIMDLSIDSIYFGGGTPSTFPTEYIKNLLHIIHNKFNITKNTEISFEMNPEDVSKTYLSNIIKAGINRISLGVQSFNDNECTLLGRNHNVNQSLEAIKLIKNEIENFNLDLIFSIPNSNTSTLKHSIESAISFNPKHISCYSLTIEPDTPFYRNKIKKSEENEDIKQFTYIIDTLKNSSYSHYEISSFAYPGYECKHNQKYWDFANYIGIGTGAHSLLNSKKFKKTSKILNYIKQPLKTELTCNTHKELIIENIIANLRRTNGLNFKDYSNNYNINFNQVYNNPINLLSKNKLITKSNNGFKLTKKGLYLLDDVCLSFL